MIWEQLINVFRDLPLEYSECKFAETCNGKLTSFHESGWNIRYAAGALIVHQYVYFEYTFSDKSNCKSDCLSRYNFPIEILNTLIPGYTLTKQSLQSEEIRKSPFEVCICMCPISLSLPFLESSNSVNTGRHKQLTC